MRRKFGSKSRLVIWKSHPIHTFIVVQLLSLLRQTRVDDQTSPTFMLIIMSGEFVILSRVPSPWYLKSFIVSTIYDFYFRETSTNREISLTNNQFSRSDKPVQNDRKILRTYIYLILYSINSSRHKDLTLLSLDRSIKLIQEPLKENLCSK